MKSFFQNIAFWAIYGMWYALSLLPLWVHYHNSDRFDCSLRRDFYDVFYCLLAAVFDG